MPLTNVFAKAGLDNITSAMCRHQQRFALNIQFSVSVFNFIIVFSIEHLCWAFNEFPAFANS